jgi:hypothetical protein
MIAGNRTNGSYYRYEFRADRRRLHASYRGVWSEQTAREALDDFRQALERASVGGLPFTLLDDFRDWEVQPPEVTEMASSFERVLGPFPISRNAMIIPSQLVRMQVRRTLTDFQKSKIFETFDDANQWLAEIEQSR